MENFREAEILNKKKESFENRAGIIMALIGALFVFVMEHISFDDIAKLCQLPLTFILLLKIIVGIGAYLLLIVALAFSFFTISTRKQDNYPISAINLAYLAESRANSIARIIMEYRTIILNHRDLNEKRASNFKKSLIFSILSILCLIIYFVF